MRLDMNNIMDSSKPVDKFLLMPDLYTALVAWRDRRMLALYLYGKGCLCCF